MGHGGSPFSNSELEVLTTLNLVLSCFSFLGSSFIIFMYLRVRTLRSFVFRCIFYLSISDVAYSFANMLGDPESSGLCYFQGLMISYFNLASVLWTTTVAFTLHQTMLLKNATFHAGNVERMMLYYHLICWGLPFVLTLLPLTTSSYGDAGAWCWLKNNDDADVAWRMLQFYGPLWACIAYNAYVYVRVIQMVATFRELADAEDHRIEHEPDSLNVDDLSMSHQQSHHHHHPHQHQQQDSRVVETKRVVSDEVPGGGDASSRFKTLERVRYYPLVLIVCYFWATVNRIHDLASDDAILWLAVLHTIGAASQGMLNSLVYGYTPAVRDAFMDLLAESPLAQYCSCILRHRSSTSTSIHREQTQELHSPVQNDRDRAHSSDMKVVEF